MPDSQPPGSGIGTYGRPREIAGEPTGAERQSSTALLHNSPYRVSRVGTAGTLPPRYFTTTRVFLTEAELVKSLLPG